MYTQAAVDVFLATLKKRKQLPAKIEISQAGDIFFVNAFDQLSSHIITDSVSVGVSRDPLVATMKAVVERLERQALVYQLEKPEFRSIRCHRSDGLAAFPVFGDRLEAERRARENALAEAIERYVWATWWDDPAVAFTLTEVESSSPLMSESRSCLEVVETATPVRRLLLIEPTPALAGMSVAILFAELETGGWISGGAAGPTNELAAVIFRAMSEMVRHSLGYQRIRQDGLKPETFYEKRLFFFASGQGNNFVESRLIQMRSGKIDLPSLQIDSEVAHPNSDIVVVHRVLFENQPPFVGGQLERLCL